MVIKTFILRMFIFVCFPVILLGQIEEMELELKVTLGSTNENVVEGDLLLHWPISADVDSQKNMYILDSGNQRVLKFDKNNNLIWETGRKGQGPGEFLFLPGYTNCGCLSVSRSGEVYVVDNQNARVQVFDRNGQYMWSFRLPWTVDCIQVNRQGEIYLNANTGQSDHLIYVFSKDGSYLTSFADKLVKNPQASDVNQLSFSLNDNGDIFILFSNWPLIRKYDSNNKLIWEKNIDVNTESFSKIIRTKTMKNVLQGVNKHDFKPEYFKTHSSHEDELMGRFGIITKSIYILDDRIFLLYNPDIILELSLDGTPHRVYHVPDHRWAAEEIVYNEDHFLLLESSQILIYK